MQYGNNENGSEGDDDGSVVQLMALPKNTTTGGSAMRLCGIVLPPSKKLRESYTMLFSLLMPISHARLHEQLSLIL